MPFHRPRTIGALIGMAVSAALLVAPATALGGRPVQASQTYVVVLRAPDGPSLPTRRGGLRPGATAIAGERAVTIGRTIDALEQRVGFQAGMRYTYAVSGFAARLTAVQAAALRGDRRVASIRPDRPVQLAADPDLPVPVGVRRVKARQGSGPAVVAGVGVAVVDTGIGRWEKPAGATQHAWRHGDELNVVDGVDAYTIDPNLPACGARFGMGKGRYDDDHGHGTHVAGTIGAADDGVGVVGVAPGVKLFSVKVFQNGYGSEATVICGLDWIHGWNLAHPDEEQDIDVVNMSLRGYSPANANSGCDNPANTDAEELAVCRVVATKALVIVAAGNEDSEVADYIPSRYASVITVAAMSDFDGVPGGLAEPPCGGSRGTEVDDTFARFSNWGPEVDIAAPGTCVRSTDMGSATGTVMMSGTSMATPHVAGAVARYLGLHPSASTAVVRSRLLASGSHDWDAATDPDGDPDRLLDVAALLADEPDIAVWGVPQEIGVSGDTDQQSVKVRLQRIGGYDGPVTLDTGDLPAGVAAASFADATIPAGGLGRSLTLTFQPDAPDGHRELVLRAEAVEGGHSDQTTLSLRFDRTAPVIGDPWPRIVLRKGSWVGRAPVRLTWSAADEQGALSRVDVQRARNGGAFSLLTRLGGAATRLDTTLETWTTTAWRVVAQDRAGNTTVSDPLSTRLSMRQSGAVTLGPGWKRISRSGALNRDLITTSTTGRSVTFTFVGRGVGVVAPTGTGKGRFRVRIDGRSVALIDQSKGGTAARRVVFASGDLSTGSHTIKVVSRGGRVELDAFLVLK